MDTVPLYSWVVKKPHSMLDELTVRATRGWTA
jgi:hypothetical protein